MYQTPPTWVSNSTITDSLKCPRAYFLKNVYKNERGKKIALVSPSLTLGQAVHDVLEPLAKIKAQNRFDKPLSLMFESVWGKLGGKNGGFKTKTEEKIFYQRGMDMLNRVSASPGPLANPAIRLTSPDQLPPRYFLSTSDNILLCGKIDWLEYLPDTDSVHIIDFKTGKYDEDDKSMQLPIYCLLVKNLQKRNVKKISYWYIDREDTPREMPLPDLEAASRQILEQALQVKKMRENRAYACPSNGCRYCLAYESILSGDAEYIGMRGYQDIYVQS